MQMKHKINLLIGFSTAVLIALSAVQYYLVKTTYEYKVEQFHAEIKEKIANFTNDFSAIDSTIFYKKDLLYKQLAEKYIEDKDVRFSIKTALLQNDYKSDLAKKLDLKLQKEFPNLKINFAVVLNKFVVYNNIKKADTLFAEKPLIGNKLYGDLTSLDNAFLIRNYVGTTSSAYLKSDYKLLTEDSLYVSVQDWELIIWKRMTLILVLALFSILTLITLFVMALKALIQQKKVSDMKTDFINNITHELKTPLATLAISTKILERKDIRENDDSFDSIITTISRQNNRLQDLIDQVITNSLGYEEIELQKEKISSTPFLDSIVADFKLAHPAVTITTAFNAVNTTLTLDKFHLTTAMLNVLENAVKYGCKNIVIQTAVHQDQFNISIQDDGIGIPKNKQSLLFDKFYRVNEGNLHNAKGLGLGLYYVDQIIKAHQGTIAVISDLGKGANFTISIPTV